MNRKEFYMQRRFIKKNVFMKNTQFSWKLRTDYPWPMDTLQPILDVRVQTRTTVPLIL